MNAKQFAAARKGIIEHFGKDVAEGKETKEYLSAIAPLAKYAKMDKSRITASITADWIAANPDWKAAAKKVVALPQPANPDHAVFCDAERRTCIRVSVDRKFIRYIPMDTSLHVAKATHMEFEQRYTNHMKDYPVKQAAQMYLGANWLEASPEAKRHLEFLISGKFKDAVKPLNFEDKESIMATGKPAVKAAKKVAAPKPAAKAAKVSAPKAAAKEAKVAGPDNRKITVLVGENPKRGSAAERFDLYKKNATVDKYVAAGGKKEDIGWDVKKGFISVA
jgi:hypothetical protein